MTTEFPFLVQHLLEGSARRLPDKVALVCGENRLTYRQIDQQAKQLARCLGSLGIRRQDRVAILLDNSAESVISLFGILKAGAIFLMLGAGVKTKKLNHILRDAGACALITTPEKAGIVQEAIANASDLKDIIWIGSIANQSNSCSKIVRHHVWADFLSAPFEPSDNKFELSHRVPSPRTVNNAPCSGCTDQDLATIIYTSGSSGEPKGVMCAHRSVLAAVRSITQYLENLENDIIMVALPLSFDYGLYQVLMAFFFGGTVVLERAFVFPIRVIEKAVKERVTGFPLVPTMAAFLLQIENLSKFDFSALRYITNTAAALPVAHIRKLQFLFPHVTLFSMYGLTECKRVSYLPPEQLSKRPNSVGIPIPNVEVFILDKSGNEVSPGEIGELVIQGPNVMQGYWNAPEETAKKFRLEPSNGQIRLFSGDLFKRDAEGYLYYVARNDDLIKTRGERVSPKEIENYLCELEGVAEATIIGVQDDLLGQAIKAFIVKEAKKMISQGEILRYCSKALEPFMIPKYIEFRETLPRNESGKIDKRQLK